MQTLPSRWHARIVGLFWIFAGVVFIALYTAQLTATLTTQQIRGAINGPADLPGKRVAAIAGSAAAQYLHEVGAVVQDYPDVDQVMAALLDEKTDAILANGPSLRYLAAHDEQQRVSPVGPEIRRQEIGFVFQLDSPLRKKVGRALIALREDGTYQQIYERRFGSE